MFGVIIGVKTLFRKFSNLKIGTKILSISLLGFFVLGLLLAKGSDSNKKTYISTPPKAQVLATQAKALQGSFNVNVPAYFNDFVNIRNDMQVDGTATFGGDVFIQGERLEITSDVIAPNLVYSATAGDGISITGTQDLTIENTGVTSFQGQTGEVALTAGNNITISGTTISANVPNNDRFSTVSDGTNSFNASGADTVTFLAGTGISLSTNTTEKEITISSTVTGNVSGVGDGLALSSGIASVALLSAQSGTGSTSSYSGLEFVGASDQLTLLQGCGNGELLKFNTGTNVWECASDQGGASGIIIVEENDVQVTATAGTLDFAGSDFTLSESPLGEINVAIDYANSEITRNNQNETISGNWTFSGDVTLSALAAGSGSLLCVDGSENIVTCTGGGVTSLNSLSGALTIANATTGGSTITIDDASTAQKGIAQFNSTNFSAASGTINTIQNINTAASPTFAGLTLSGLNANGIVHTNGTGVLSTSALNLAGGSSYVTGILPAVNGGTGINTSASTGVPSVSSGTWSINATLATSLGGLGADVSAVGAGEILYSTGASAYDSLAAGNSGECLVSGGTGAPSWTDCAGAAGITTYWDLTSGAITPKNTTVDFLLGGTSTASAKFAVLNINGIRGNQTATLSGSLTLDSAGSIQTTNRQTLTLGGSTTGDILLSPSTERINADGTLNLTSGNTYQINGTDVLSATTLGANVINSSLTSVGTIGTGVWQGTAVASQYGGTGQNFSSSTGVPYISSGTWSTEAQLAAARGGTGQNFSSSTGVPSLSSGTWSVNATLAPSLGGTGQNFGSSTGVISVSSGTFSALSQLTTALGGLGADVSAIGGGEILYSVNASTYDSLAAGNSGECLVSGGTGAPSWTDCAGATGIVTYWDLTSGILNPKNTTLDFAIGGTSTQSAKFAVIGVNDDTPVATISASDGRGITLGYNGTLQTTLNQTLSIGGGSTGNISLGQAGRQIILPGYTGQNGILYATQTTGVLTQATTSTPGECLISGASAPVWGPCDGSSSVNVWELLSGAIVPGNTTTDLLIGGTTTESAKFAVIGVDTDTPVATISASGGEGIYLSYDGSIQTTLNRTLTLGGDTTGDIVLSGFGAGAVQTDSSGVLSSGMLSVLYGGLGADISAAGGGEILYSVNASTYDSLAAGNSGECLVSGGTGAPSWTDCAGATGIVTYWDLVSGALTPKNSTLDLLVGGTTTSSARFAVLGVNDDTPVASISASNGQALVLGYDGTIQTTLNQPLTVGGADTGNINFFNTTNYLTSAGALTLASTITANTTNTINGLSINAGTITGGTWNGTAISSQYGGTGQNFSSSTGVPSLSSGTWSVNATLAPSLGGTGQNFGSSTGVISVSSGTFSALSQLTTALGGLGADVSAIGGGEILYSVNASTYDSLAAGNSGECLVSGGTGAPSWTDCAGATGIVTYWDLVSGALTPKNETYDFLLGGTSTESAKFAILGISETRGTQTATLSGSLTLDSAGSIQTTQEQTLSIGDGSSGNLLLGRTGKDIVFGSSSLSDCTALQTVNGIIGCGTDDGITSYDNFWQYDSSAGIVANGNLTTDLLLGGTSTQSAKFAFINNAGGIPTASISAGLAGGIYITANGTLTTTAYQDLNIGGSDNGNITLTPKGGTGRVNVDGELNLISGNTYQINGIDVLSATTLGANVLTSSLTTVGTIGTGVWQGTAVASQYGGTGQNFSSATGVPYISSGSWSTEAQLSASRGGLGEDFSAQTGVVSVSGGDFAALSQLTTALGGLGADVSAIGGGEILYSVNASTYDSLAAGNSGECLVSGGTGAPSWTNCAGAIGEGASKWSIASGAISTIIPSLDLLLGGTTTDSAKFAFINVADGVPTASISAGLNGALTITADGQIQTTSNQSISIGGGNSGNIILGQSGRDIILPGFTGQNGILYGTQTTGLLSQATTSISGLCLISGASAPTWTDCAGAIGEGSSKWTIASGALSPIIPSLDLLLGGSTTSSARFAFIGVESDDPIASISASNGNALSLSNTGVIQTSMNQTLTLGGSTTGDILLSPSTGRINADGTLNLTTGNTYQINGNNVLSVTALGANVVTSSLTSVGTLTSGTWNANVITSQYGGTGQNFSSSTGVPSLSSGTWSVNATLAPSLGGTGQNFGSSTGVISVSSGTFSALSQLTTALGGLGADVSAIGGGEILYSVNASTYDSLAAGNSGECLVSGGTGAPSWTDCSTASNDDWNLVNGALSPRYASTVDFLLGGTSTESAKFAVIGINDARGSQIASISGNLVLDANASIQTTLSQNLTLGGSTTGNILLNADGSNFVGIGTASPLSTLDISGTTRITNPSDITDYFTISSGATETTLTRVTDGGTLGNVTINSAGTLTAANLVGSSLTIDAFTTDGGLLYTNGSGLFSQLATGTDGQCLIANTGAAPEWGACDGSASVNVFSIANGAIIPGNTTLDFMLGGTSTSSAKFAITNINGARGSQIATLSGSLVLDAAGSLQTTDNQTLTIGGVTTGEILFLPSGGGGLVSIDGALNLTSGNTFQINGTDVLSATTLGSNVVTSSLTSVGTIGTGVWQATAVASQYGGTGQNFSGATGVPYINSGAWSTEAQLSPSRGGTGQDTSGVLDGQLLIGNDGTNGFTLATLTPGNGIAITNGAGSITIGQTTESLSKFTQDNTLGILTPNNNTLDLLVGGATTESAKFAFLNVAGGTPTASISASGDIAAYLTGAGVLGTTNSQTLTLGSTSTGDIVLDPGTGNIRLADLATCTSLETVNGLLTCGTDDGILTYDNFWQYDASAGIIAQGNLTTDVLFGATSTESAKFAFLNISGARGTQTASISGSILLDSAGSLQTTNNQTLSIGGGTTGDIIISPRDGSGYLDLTGTQRIINASDPTDFLSIVSGNSLTTLTRVTDGGTLGNVTIDSNGTLTAENLTGTSSLTLSAFNTNGGLVYTNGSGLFSQLGTGTTGQCLLSNTGAAPSWGSCDGVGSVNVFEFANGTVRTTNQTTDLLVGGTSTESAKFAILGVNNTRGSQIASLSGSLTLDTAGSIQTTNRQTLSLGGATTGLIEINNSAGSPFATFDPYNSRLGIGARPTYSLQIENGGSNGGIRVNNNNGNAYLILDSGKNAQSGNQISYIDFEVNDTLQGNIAVNEGISGYPLELNSAVSNNISLAAGGGDVGIGTTSPNSELHVIGGLCVEAIDTNCNAALGGIETSSSLIVGGHTTLGNSSLDNITFYADDLSIPNDLNIDSNTLFIDAGGNFVGLGTNTPTSALDVVSSANPPTRSTRTSTSTSPFVTSLALQMRTTADMIDGAGTNISFRIQDSAAVENSIALIGASRSGADNSGALGFHTSNSGTSSEKLTILPNGSIGLGTTTPSSEFHVTRPLAFGTTGKSLAIFDQIENQDILTASSSGTTRFRVANNGDITLYDDADTTDFFTISNSGTNTTLTRTTDGGTLGNVTINSSGTLTAANLVGSSLTIDAFTTNGGLLYTNGSGVFAQLGAGDTGECLIGVTGNAPSWGACDGASSVNVFEFADGTARTTNQTVDLLIGGVSTESAKFAITNINGTRGTQAATLSGNLTLDAAGSIQTTNKQLLTIGGDTTGEILFRPGNNANNLFLRGDSVAIGNQNPQAALDVSASSFLSAPVNKIIWGSIGTTMGALGYDGSSANEIRIGAISDVGLQLITNDTVRAFISNTGNFGIGTTSPTAKLDVAGTASVSGQLSLYGTPTIQSTALQTLTIGGSTTGNIAINPKAGNGTVFINQSSSSPTVALAIGNGNALTANNLGQITFNPSTGSPSAQFINSTTPIAINETGTHVQSDNSLSTGIRYSGYASYGDYVYLVGGFENSVTSAVYYAKTNPDGTIGPWIQTASLPAARYVNSVVEYKGYLYSLGGHDGGNPQSTVYYTKINSNGTLDSWTSTSSLSAARHSGAAVAYDGYIYYLGGSDLSNAQTNTYVAQINADGSLGSFSAGNTLSVARSSGVAVAKDGYVYLAGGVNSVGTVLNTVHAATLTSGTIGTWNATNNLPAARNYPAAALYNGKMVVTGGSSSIVAGGSTNTIYFANLSGGTATWTSATATLASYRFRHMTAITNGFIFTYGGEDTGGTRQSTVYSAPMQSTAFVYNSSNNFNQGHLLDLWNANVRKFAIDYAGNITASAGAVLKPYIDAADALGISTANGTQYVNFDSVNQRVGIGTKLPTAKLDVAGTASISGQLVLYGTPTIQSTAFQTLTVGGNTTGHIVLDSGNGTVRFADTTLSLTAGTTINPISSGTLSIGTANTSTLTLGTLTTGTTNIDGGNINFNGNTNVASGYSFSVVSGTSVITGPNSGSTTTLRVNNHTSTASIFVAQDAATDVFTIADGGDITATNILTLSGTRTRGNSALIINQQGPNDLFTASASGTTLFTITNTGGIGLGASVDVGGGTQCLLGGAAPSWGSCDGASSVNTFEFANGTVRTTNQTTDLLVGGSSTSSAKFAFLNVAGSLSPVASISATTDSGGNGNGIALGADGTIQSLRSNTLTIGGNTTGNIALMPQAGNGYVGIGTTSPVSQLHIKAQSNGGIIIDEPSFTARVKLDFREGGGNTEGGRINYDASLSIPSLTLSVLNSGTERTAIYIPRGTNSLYTAGAVGIGNSQPKAQLDVTRVLSYGATGKALAIFNQIENQDIFTASSSGTTRFVISNNGSVGIGTSTPAFKLDLIDSQTSTVAALLTNSSTDSNADVLALKVGATTAGTNNNFLTFLNGNGAIIGKVTGNGSGGVTYATDGIDFAEYYKKENASETFAAGDLVCLGAAGGVTKCGDASNSILGIVSDRAGFVGGSHRADDPSYVLVGIVGQLEVKVTGTVKPGDKLTSSSLSGIARVADTAGYVVGRALASHNSSEVGKVMVALGVMYAFPDMAIDVNGNINGAENAPDDIFDAIEQTEDESLVEYGPDTNPIEIEEASMSAKLAMLEGDMSTVLSEFETMQEKLSQMEQGSLTLTPFASSSGLITSAENLMVYGTSTFNDVSIETLTIGTSMKITSNSIDTIGETLALQSLKQGSLSVMGGAVIVETDGTLKVNENAVFAKDVEVQGVLSATSISALGEELSVSGSARFERARFETFEVEKNSGTERLSDIMVRNDDAAGKVILKAGETEVTVLNEKVIEETLIFITPNTYIPSQSLYVDEQIDGTSFTVKLPEAIETDIEFNFLLVN